MKILRKFSSKFFTALYIFVPILALLPLTFSLFGRGMTFDDAWFGEQIYFLDKEGVVRSELFRGFLGWDKQIFVFHKLHIYAGAFFSKIWGFSLFAVKAVELFYLFFLALVFYFSARRFWASDKLISSFALASLFLTPLVIEFSFASRPELLCAALGLASFSFLVKSNPSVSLLLLAGLCAGLSALTHLNGIVYLAAGCLTLYIRPSSRYSQNRKTMRKFSVISYFCTGFGLGTALYFVDVILAGSFAQMIYQFQSDPAVRHGITAKFFNIIDLPDLFGHTAFEAILTILVLISGVWLARKNRIKNDPLLLYLISLLISYGILANRNTRYYYLLFLPFFLVVIWRAIFLVHVKPFAIWLLLGFFGISGIYKSWELKEQGKTAFFYKSEEDQILKDLYDRGIQSVLVPNTAFFAGLGRFRMQGLNRYLQPEQGKGWNNLSVFEEANSLGLEALVFEKRPDFSYFELIKPLPKEMAGYHLISSKGQFHVYLAEEEKTD